MLKGKKIRLRENDSFEKSRTVFEDVRKKCLQLAVFYGSMSNASKFIGINEATFTQWVNEEYRRIPTNQGIKLLNAEYKKVQRQSHPNTNEEIYKAIKAKKNLDAYDQHLVSILKRIHKKYPNIKCFKGRKESSTSKRKCIDGLLNKKFTLNLLESFLGQFTSLQDVQEALSDYKQLSS